MSRAFNRLAAGIAMASVTPELIAPVPLFSSILCWWKAA
jgi:hypothetical protein